MEPNFARAVLQEGCSILRSLGVKYWLSSGTALGWHRDRLSDEFLRMDSDLDIDVEGDANYPAIKAAFEAAHFEEIDTYLIGGRRGRTALVKDSIVFDIYFYERDGGDLVNVNECGTIRQSVRFTTAPPVPPDSLSWAILPQPIEEYLDQRYTASWRAPKNKSGLWWENTANLRPRPCRTHIFWHIAAMGHWREVVAEQARVLAAASFDGPITIGFVGQPFEDGFVRHVLDSQGLLSRANVVLCGGDFKRYEFPTLELLEKRCRDDAAWQGHVLYFHTKGVTKPNCWMTTMWRWLMNAWCLRHWRALEGRLLASSADVAGTAWVPGMYPAAAFAGNFWHAKASHIRRLTPLAEYIEQFRGILSDPGAQHWGTRHAAEFWINAGCSTNPLCFGPGDSRLWDHAWWRVNPSVEQFAVAHGN